MGRFQYKTICAVCDRLINIGEAGHRQFQAAWERFAADEADLTEFLNMKRQLR